MQPCDRPAAAAAQRSAARSSGLSAAGTCARQHETTSLALVSLALQLWMPGENLPHKDWISMPASKSKQLERSESCQLWMPRENLRPKDRSSILGSNSPSNSNEVRVASYGCRARTCASTRGVRRSRRTPKQLEHRESCRLWMQSENLRLNERSSTLASNSQATRTEWELPHRTWQTQVFPSAGRLEATHDFAVSCLCIELRPIQHIS